MDLTMLIYELTAGFPKHEVYGLTSQMRRAAVSIASNLAEDPARNSKKDFGQFVTIARGSNCELQTQLMIAGRLRYAKPENIAQAESHCNEVARMLNGLSDYLKVPPKLRTNN